MHTLKGETSSETKAGSTPESFGERCSLGPRTDRHSRRMISLAGRGQSWMLRPKHRVLGTWQQAPGESAGERGWLEQVDLTSYLYTFIQLLG